MAQKTIYKPRLTEIGVERVLIDYEYFSGFALSQKQKCIKSLHNAAKNKGINQILEISSKSPSTTGIELSAFNLSLTINQSKHSVEQVFQSCKVFERGGPYTDLLGKTSREAKTDERLKTSGNIISFNYFGESFQTVPMTLFYDWLYANALLQNKPLLETLGAYDGFSDIEFNEKKSINCQAYSLALFCSIMNQRNEILEKQSISKEEFLDICKNEYKTRWN